MGPPGGACTNGAWSPDGNWIYLSVHAGDNFHIWRQRFPGGEPEQLTSGPTEEEGIAPAADGRSLLTAVGLRQRTVSIDDARGDRQVSLEGYAYSPMLSPNGKKLYYRILKGGISPFLGASELWVADLDSGHNGLFLPDFAVTHCSLSNDGSRMVFSALDSDHKSRLWLAPTDRRTAPRQVPNAEGDMAYFGRPGELVFHAVEGGSTLAIRIREDGTGRQAVTPQQVSQVQGVSPDGQWVIGDQGSAATMAFPMDGGPPVPIFSGMGNLRWQREGKMSLFRSPDGHAVRRHQRQNLCDTTAPRQMFPPCPPAAFTPRPRSPLSPPAASSKAPTSPPVLRRTCMRSRDRRCSVISIGFRCRDLSDRHLLLHGNLHHRAGDTSDAQL